MQLSGFFVGDSGHGQQVVRVAVSLFLEFGVGRVLNDIIQVEAERGARERTKTGSRVQKRV